MKFDLQSFLYFVGGIVGSIIISLALTKKKSLYWSCSIIPLLTESAGKMDGLKISYNSQDLTNMACAHVAIWNNGRETIKESDIATPITITPEAGYRILYAEIVEQTDESNDVSVELLEDGKVCVVHFKYLDHKQGAVLRIFGDIVYPDHLAVGGKIMGCKTFRKARVGDAASYRMNWGIVVISMLTILTSIYTFIEAGIKGYNLESHFLFRVLPYFLPVYAIIVIAGIMRGDNKVPPKFRKYLQQ